jgi:hypothetical protein
MAKVTVDHEEIRKWVEERGGNPACVKGTGGSNDPGLLRIDYPGFSGEETLQAIEWDEFFQGFDGNNLAFLYQPEGDSRFSKLVNRGTVDVSGGGRARRAGGAASRPSSTKKAASRKAASRKASSKKASSKKASSSKKQATSSKKASAKKASSKKASSSKKRPASTKKASKKASSSTKRGRR